MTRLEQRYRRVLRVLPAAYREVWEEEMVGTFLATFLEGMDADDVDAAECAADFGRPSWSEVASVLGLAVRLRLGVAGASPRWAAWGHALRLVALMVLLVNAAAVTIDAGSRLWLSGRLGLLPAPSAEWVFAAPTGTLPALWDLAGLLWLPAYVGLLLGQVRAARVLAIFAVLAHGVAAVSATFDLAAGATPLLLTIWSHLLVDALVVLGLAAFHHDAPPVPRRPWLLAFAVGIALLLGLYLPLRAASPSILVDWPGLYCLLVLGVAVAHLTAPERWALRAPRWSLALVPLALSVLGMRVLSLLDYAVITAGTERAALLAVGVAEALAVLAVAGPLARRATSALRSLQAETLAPTSSRPPIS
jgi:hypothetical protein